MERNPKLTENARMLRKRMTKEEAHLWHQCLRQVQPRFHRQYVIGNYIADFYCHQAKLVVELDGSQHYDPQTIEYDRKRTAYFEEQGLTVIRFTNLDVKYRFKRVCDAIYQEVEARTVTET